MRLVIDASVVVKWVFPESAEVVSADDCYVRKAKRLGRIVSLASWQGALPG
jgi:predicted nucleic acid-binding protein